MNIRNELIETMQSLKSHPWSALVERFEKNVDTENMVSWDHMWKAYHLECGLKLRELGIGEKALRKQFIIN